MGKEKVRDYNRLAHEILEMVGGEENVENAVHCATRLRLVLKKTTPEMKAKVSELAGVITVVENSGQFQVVIGPHVGEVYDQFVQLVDLDETDDQTQAPKQSILNRVIATMSAVFAPFIYILAAAGILQGILILINLGFHGFDKTGTYQVLSFMSWAPFTFLPILIAITAAKHFKSNIYIAILCCSALVSPDWTRIAGEIANGHAMNFMGIPLTSTVYTSSVLPPLLLVWLLSYLEKFLEKRLPEVIKALAVPFICLVVMVPLTIILIGPVSQITANGVANGYNWLVRVAPPVAGLIIGGFWQVFVIFGVHWGITPVVMANFDMYGMDSFQAFQTVAVVSQVGAALGVFFKTKNKKLKSVSLSAFITGIFGITEPTIYGVTLRLKKPFIYACISGAIGGLVTSLFNAHYFAYAGLPGLLTTVNGISSKYPSSFIGIILGCAVAIVGPVLIIHFLGTGEKEVATETVGQSTNAVTMNNVASTKTVINSPLKGTLMALSQIKDPVFSSGAMGNGVAIQPADNRIYAPMDGEIMLFAETKHAIGIRNEMGVELLMHIGMDTVELKGQYFTAHAKVGQSVKQGDLLLEFDQPAIEAAGYSVVTPVVVTNSADFKAIQTTAASQVEITNEIMTIQ